MTIRLYLDEDASDLDLVNALRLRGIDVTTVEESAMRGLTDEQQLHWATQQNRVMYSFNRSDFYRLHAQWMRRKNEHAGIILGVQQRYSVGEQLHRLLRLMNKIAAEEMRNRVEFLSAWG